MTPAHDTQLHRGASLLALLSGVKSGARPLNASWLPDCGPKEIKANVVSRMIVTIIVENRRPVAARGPGYRTAASQVTIADEEATPAGLHSAKSRVLPIMA